MPDATTALPSTGVPDPPAKPISGGSLQPIPSPLPPQRRILLAAIAVVILLCMAIASVAPARHVLLFLTGALGAVLAGSALWARPVAGFVLPGGVSVMLGAFSLHGWPWIVFAVFGTWAGLHVRPFFGLSVAPPLKR